MGYLLLLAGSLVTETSVFFLPCAALVLSQSVHGFVLNDVNSRLLAMVWLDIAGIVLAWRLMCVLFAVAYLRPGRHKR